MKHLNDNFQIKFVKRFLYESTDRVLKLEKQNYKNFWTPLIQDISDQLPIQESKNSDSYVDRTMKFLDPVSSQSETHTLIQKNENFMNICRPLLRAPVSKYTFQADSLRCKTIKLISKVHCLWKQWIKLSILMYNKSLEILRKEKLNKFKLRNKIKQEFKNEIKNIKIPETTIAYSAFDAKLAFQKSKKAKNRNYKQTSHSIAIDGRNIRDGFIYKTNTKNWLLNNHPDIFNVPIKKILKVKTEKICRIVYKRILGSFSLVIPETIKKIKPKKRFIISLDPGVRSFLTFYDGKSSGEIGKNMNIKLNRLNKQMDALDKRISEEKKFYRKCNLKKAKSRIQFKKENIVKDLHCKACNFLKRYAYIILPIFNVKNMISKDKALPKKVRRSMLDLSHFKFRQRLIQKTEETGSIILFCNEIMTSKTCTKCGKINEMLGKSKTFKCPSCHIEIDRDVNGARNILLRALRGSSTFSH